MRSRTSSNLILVTVSVILTTIVLIAAGEGILRWRYGGLPPGPLSPRFEEPLHRFHNMLADCMTLDSLAALIVPPGDRPGEEADRLGTAPNPNPPAIDAG